MKFKMMLKQFKLNILRYWNKGNSFTDCIKKLCGCHAFWCLWINLVQTWYDHNDDRYYWTLQFDTSLLDLDLDSKVTGMQESKHFCAKYLTKYSINWDRIWYTVETFWCDKSYIDVILSIQLSREKSLLMWFRSFFVFVFVFCFALAYIQTFRNQMFSNLVVWWRPLCTTFWYQFGWPWLSFKVTVVWEIKTSVSILSEISLLIWMKFTILPQPVGLLKLLLNLVFTIKIQMRKHCWWCFIFYGGGKKKKKKKIYIYGRVSGHLWTDLIQTWHDARQDKSLQYDSSFNDLEIHSRSQGYGKAWTCSVSLLWSCLKQLKCLWWLVMTVKKSCNHGKYRSY